MPIFDFECAKCKAVFEFSRPFGSKENPACPACKSKKTEKLFSAPTVVFKGEGWYKTAGRKNDSVAEVPKTSAETKETKGTKEKKVSETAKEPKPAEATSQSRDSGKKKDPS
jgi:putative FmdB family regulatory protein